MFMVMFFGWCWIVDVWLFVVDVWIVVVVCVGDVCDVVY